MIDIHGARERARCILIHQIEHNIGQKGVNTTITSNFIGRGNIKPWSILTQDVDRFHAIQHLGDDIPVTDEVQASV